MDNNEQSRLIWALTLILLGSVLNLFVAVFNAPHLNRLSPSSVLVVSLCISDFVFSTNNVITISLRLSQDNEAINTYACRVRGAISVWTAMLSLGLVTGLTLFRYLTVIIGSNIQARQTLIYLTLYAGTTAGIAAVPFIIGDAEEVYALQPSKITCSVAFWNPRARWMSAVCAALTIVPVTTIALAYFQIFKQVSRVFGELHQSSAEGKEGSAQGARCAITAINSAHGLRTVSLLSSANGTRQENVGIATLMSQDRERQRNLLLQSIALVSCFLIGWTPYLVFGMVEVIAGRQLSIDFEFPAEMCIALNEVASPIIALIFDRQLRHNVVRVFGRGKRTTSLYRVT
ncbi:hypothetical protein BC830DRAFT_775347 [Chytriomyces sp. MP71]|nr:hypothetical protein BC830DRAFT_775347 [Chytriomyces sp. MP71]